MHSRGSRALLGRLAQASGKLRAWHGSVGLLVVLAAGGCSPTEAGPPSVPSVASTNRPPRPSEPAPTAVAQATLPEPVEPQPSLPRAHTDSLLIWIENVEGTTAAIAGVLFAPLQDPVERCLPPQPGVLQVRVARQGGRTDVAVEPEAKVDPSCRQCVLAALKAMDLGAGLPTDGSTPPEVPSFSSTVHISW